MLIKYYSKGVNKAFTKHLFYEYGPVPAVGYGGPISLSIIWARNEALQLWQGTRPALKSKAKITTLSGI